MNNSSKNIAISLTLAVAFLFGASFVPVTTYAAGDKVSVNGVGGYGGGQITRVDVCRATGSRFLPYVKVKVPASIASVWVSTGVGVYPVNGKCPKGINVRDYVRDLFSSFF